MLTRKIQSAFYSIVLVPLSSTQHFFDLKYSKGEPNKVLLDKTISIVVNKSASPLFYKFEKVKKIKLIEISGAVEIKKPIDSQKDDAYFQLGVIYKGDYKPNVMMKMFLPEWLKKVLSLNEDYGLNQITFYEVSEQGKVLSKEDKIRDIKLKFKTIGELSQQSTFKFDFKPDNIEVLGLWFRSDGDDSGAVFKTVIKSLKVNY